MVQTNLANPINNNYKNFFEPLLSDAKNKGDSRTLRLIVNRTGS